LELLQDHDSSSEDSFSFCKWPDESNLFTATDLICRFYGSFTPIDEDNEKVFAYIRSQGNFGYLIKLNWSTEEYEWKVPEEIPLGRSVLMIGNYEVKVHFLEPQVVLRPFEARIYTIRA
jgi:hypothetical protein